jgi:hypothetical protein
MSIHKENLNLSLLLLPCYKLKKNPEISQDFFYTFAVNKLVHGIIKQIAAN